MIETAKTGTEQYQKSTTKVRPFSSPIVVGSVRLLRPGSLLIKAGAETPQLASATYRVGGWNLVDGVNAYDVDAFLRHIGWSLHFMVPKFAANAVALTYAGALRKALRKAFRKVDLQGFNALEIAAIRRRNCFGMKCVRVIVHLHHARRSPYVRDLDPHKRVERAWDFKRVRQAARRKTRHLKAI